MDKEQQLALRAALRADLRVFAHKTFRTLEPATAFRENWHLDTFGYHLRRVARGECRRLIINVPPRSMKSIYASVAFPAWLLGRDPSKKIMCVSYGHDLTRKHSLDFRTIVESDWYRRLFPGFGMERRRQRDSEITTAANGYRFASTVGGGLLGRGADFIIIDDPIKPQDAASEALRRHLTDHLATQPTVALALHLDQCWNPLLIDEEVIERPASRAAVAIGDRFFAADEEKTAVHCCAWLANEQGGKIS